MSDLKCDCCGELLAYRWSDSHGIAVCSNCGLPYRLYHYDEENRRVEKPAEMVLTAEGLTLARRYWAEKHRRVFPACFDMGIGRNGFSYSGATPGDCEAFNDWYTAQPEVIALCAADQQSAEGEK